MTKPKNKGGRPLTNKQLRFVQEYSIDFNGTQAAIRAGYSRKTASIQSFDLLRKPNIQAAVKASLDKTAAKAEISTQWVMDGLRVIAVHGVKEKDYSAANRAFELIGKHLGMFIDRTQIIDDVPMPVKVEISITDARRNISND
ncbi:MAG: terminase small subunit [Syntrophales bacterium]|nr:terminase small subunit [Syntrophales bacterium]